MKITLQEIHDLSINYYLRI